MKATSANLLSVIKGPKQFVIPIYQRTYSWHQAQCEQLFKDIIRVSQSENIHGHFVGSVVYFQESIHTVSDVPRLLVIDGQQRLTTITLLIAALAKFLTENESCLETSPTKLQNYYLFNAEEEGDLRYKLLLTRGDKDTLINLLKGVEIEGKNSQRVYENFQYFKAKINQDNIEDIYNGLMRLFIVDVALEKDVDNPQLIFESLNSTGLDLSQADLIRNYVLMGQEVDLQTELYEKYWFPMEQRFGNEYASKFDSFMRDYLCVKTGVIPNINQVYEAFKGFVIGPNSLDNISGVVADIHRFSKFYVNMVLHQEAISKLKEAFKRISKLKVDVSYPFLLAVYCDYCDELLSEDEFYEVLCLVENYVFRRAICGIPTNSLNKTFSGLHKSVKSESYLESVKAAFQLLDSYKRFPDDFEFEKEIVAKDVYNFRTRNYLLDRLENHKRKEAVSVDEYTIEHILPQNPDLNSEWKKMLGENWQDVQKEYLHTLGNITLTGYNSELSDRPFGQKKKIDGGFDDSPIRLNEYLRTTDVWNIEHIEQRAKILAEKAKLIWCSPKLANDIIDVYKPKAKQGTVYTFDRYKHLKGDMLDLYHTLRKRIINIDSSVIEEYKKLYVAFKSTTNFVDIVPQKSRLRLSLNMEFSKIHDPKSLCNNVSELGRWGNGEVEIGLSNVNEIDYAMELIQQAFDIQAEGA
ncbi:MAG: hypothetical protein ACI9Y1_003132 [Lentisphaeria bacterium]|jgi:uncharacterized protein with ParB-like and HNH nuclease domain/predicted transport protein